MTTAILNLVGSSNDDVTILKRTYGNDIIFHLGVAACKLSVLAFYYKIFKDTGRGFNRLLAATALLSVLYVSPTYPPFRRTLTFLKLFYAIPTIIWACKPINKFWYTDEPGSCLSLYTQSIVVAVWDVVLDIAILILPLPRVLRLSTDLSRKLLLLTAFVFGYWYVE